MARLRRFVPMVAVIAIAAAPTAHAQTIQLGATSPEPFFFGLCTQCHFVQLERVTLPSYVAPVSGTITSFSYMGGPDNVDTVAIQVLSISPAGWSAVAESDAHTTTPGQLNTFPTSLRIAAGQAIGLSATASSQLFPTGNAGDVASGLPGAMRVGDPPTQPAPRRPSMGVNLSATLEPDAPPPPQNNPPPPTTLPPSTPPPSSGGSAPPEALKTANVATVRGTVRIKGPGATTFAPIDDNAQIPMGSTIDASDGAVRLTTARTRSSRTTQSGTFSGGVFTISQSSAASGSGGGGRAAQKLSVPLFTNLTLTGGALGATCGRVKGAAVGRRTAAALQRPNRRVVRRLRGDARGRFRTIGRFSTTTVRGTIWLTADRCDGTLTSVTRGSVRVRDRVRAATVTVRAGFNYLAQRVAAKTPPRPTRRPGRVTGR
jgi:hypothetical protein